MARTAPTHRVRGPEPLEPRCTPAVTAALVGDVLRVTGDAARNAILVTDDGPQLVVLSGSAEVGRFTGVAGIEVNAGGGDDAVTVARSVLQSATLRGGGGRDRLRGGGGLTAFAGGGGADVLFNVKALDVVVGTGDRVNWALPALTTDDAIQLREAEVQLLLRRAAAATASTDAIIAVVDRAGSVLGVKIEDGVSPAIRDNTTRLVYSVDGALALARTAALFANAGAPLTSRTVGFLSQTTMTQREIQAYPSIPDPDSTARGPGFVAAIGVNGHFPPDVPFTPQVDLFAIEHTNRDSLRHPGEDGIKGTADDVLLTSRFNSGVDLPPPESYGLVSGLQVNAQSRGLGTLPGGIPIVRDGQVIGGIGVFFPGTTGWATEMNSELDALHDPNKADRSLEAEYMGFAAVGGTTTNPIGAIGGLSTVPGLGMPAGRIDLVGITLELFGPGGVVGLETLLSVGLTLGPGTARGEEQLFGPGEPVPEGWLVRPKDGDGIRAAEVQAIILDGVAQAQRTRAAIRLPLNSTTRMVFAVCDRDGDVVGLFRMPDATTFSIDVAVAKARNVAYYANAGLLQPQDRVEGLTPGAALTNRSIRYLALPRYPEGIDGRDPGPFSILNDPGADPTTGLQVGPRLPARAYQSVQGFDAFNPGTNFRSAGDPANENGIVFFPGSAPLYRGRTALIGGFGVSGDGVDQDDVVTAAGAEAFQPLDAARVDAVFVRGVRVPYQKFNRNPEGGVT